MPALQEKINYWLAPYVWKKKSGERLRVVWEKVRKPFFSDVPLLKNEAVVSSFIADNKKWEHQEYIKELSGNLVVDPESGFVIDDDGQIIQESIVFDHYGVYPKKLSFATKRTTELPEVVLFDHYWSLNYFHFYSDILGKLALIDSKMPALKKLPLVVSRKISETRQFRFFRQFAETRSFNWYIQEADEMIHAEKVYLLQPMPYDVANWDRVKELTKDYLKPFDEKKKIFINRPASTGRHIANFEQIRPIIEAAGFHVEEMENKSIEEQIALFSSASVIASIHGAAMANMAYCDKRCKILEVMPDERVNTHYYWLAKALGLAGYECLLGSKLELKRWFYPKGRFSLDPQKTKEYFAMYQ